MIEVMSVNCHNRGTHRNHDRSPTLPLPRLHHGSFPHLTAVFDCCGRLLHCGGRPGCVDHEWPGVRRPSGKRRGAHAACRVCVSYVAPTHPTHSPMCLRACDAVLHPQHWLGIPYAASTAGENRFMPPQPVQPWTAPLDTTAYGPGCVQTGHNADVPKVQSEVCGLGTCRRAWAAGERRFTACRRTACS